jgi:hypothetical protein
VKVAIVLALVAVALTAVLVALNSRGPDPNVVAAVQAQRNQLISQCVDRRVSRGADPVRAQAVCESRFPLQYFGVGDRMFHLSGLVGIVQGISLVTVVGGWIIGASLVGAEWGAGTVTTQLTWESRRGRVLAGKLVASALVVFLLAAILLGAFIGAMWLVAITRGTTATDPGFLRSLSATLLRSSALSALAAIFGAAIATVARNTAASMASGFLYLGVVEALIRGFRPSVSRWLLGSNGAIVVTGHDSVNEPFAHVSLEIAVLTVLAYGAILVLAAASSFRGRDVN